jgi:predicted  nucleic acid-binding Zn-ribbon protein
MALNETERAVRAAVERTLRENEVKAAEHRLERAKKDLAAYNVAGGKYRDSVKAAEEHLAQVKEKVAAAVAAAKGDPAK